MAGFNGQWALTDVQNAAVFYDAINSPEEYKEKLRKVAEAAKANNKVYIEKLVVDKAAGTFRREAIINGETKKDSGEQKFGVEAQHPIADGRPATAKVVLESDTKITRKDVGDGFDITSTYEVSGDTLTVTSTGNGVTCKFTYGRV